MKRNSDSSDHMIQEAAGERESNGKVTLLIITVSYLHIHGQNG